MNDQVREIFEKEGAISRISGNSPILLSGSRHVWCILSGSAEIFAVVLEQGRISGPKEHFFSAAAGAMLFGMDLDEYGMGQGFQAVGYPGTRIARLDLDRIIALAKEPALQSGMAALIDQWTGGLARGLTKDILPIPRPDLLLTPGTDIRADKDQIVYPREGMLWVRHLDKGGLFISAEETPADNTLLPLSPKSWLLMLKGSKIRTFSTRDVLSQNLVWSSLEAFYALIFQVLILNIGLKAADVFNLLSEKAALDRRAREDGLIRLASVMDEVKIEQTDKQFDDHLLSACAGVGKKLGLTLNTPRPPGEGAVPRKRTIEDIARASNINTRKVKLPDKWWRHDIGPLVGFRAENNQPVSLMPVSASAYDMVDPADDSRQRVTGKIAKGISSNAYTFYKTLPDRPLTGMDLAAFGLQGCSRDLIWLLLLATAIGLLSLVTPLATGHVFKEIIPGADRIGILGIAAILAGFGVATLLFEISRNISALRMENRFHYFFESALWDRLLRLPIPFFREYETGDLASRAMGLHVVRLMVSGPAVTSIIGASFSLFNLALLFYYSRTLALAASGLIALAALTVLGLSFWQIKYVRQQACIEGKIASRVMQFLSAITKLRVSGTEDSAFAVWAKDFSQKKKAAFKGGTIRNLLMTFNSTFLLFALMVIFAWMILGEKGNALATGDFLAFNAAFANLNAAVMQMVMALTNLIIAIPYLERIKPILSNYPEADTLKTDPGPLSGKIEMCHVFFRYTPDGPAVLKDISINVEPGTFLAIVGSSGSGKSTLVRLLLGFENPESGTIFYDDQNLSELDVRQVRQNMGVVVQGGNVMAGDIFNNIIGNHPLTLDDAWEAAAMAGLDKDIKDMPMGMHTVVMEGACTLSGGQRQRLMIARAVVHRPRILIFDEATSALDNQTQALVSQSLNKLKATRIVVAHRLSTIKDADRIYVMDKGEIKQSGTYDQLMAKDGLFRKLAERQII